MRQLILLIDPDPDSRYIYTEFLQSAGLRVAAVADQPSALRALEDERPDAIVTELLGERSDLARNVRELHDAEGRGAVPVIVATAWACSADRSAAAGADGFLAKPLQRDELLKQVRRVTRRRSGWRRRDL